MLLKTTFLTILVVFSFAILRAQSSTDALTQALERHYQDAALPGFAVAIVNEEGVLYQHGFGYADLAEKEPFKPNNLQNLGSVSKTVVGLALVKAIEEGKIRMDDAINEILPFPVIHPHHKDIPILVRHLANHTSGILDSKHYGKSYVYAGNEQEGPEYHQEYLGFLKSHDKISLKDFLFNSLHRKGKWYKKKNFLKASPGTSQEYSNLNAALAAYLVELATGIPFQEYTRKMIFEPLGMKSTAWTIDAIDKKRLTTLYFPAGKIVPRYALITYPDGGLYSTIEDVSLFLIAMIKAYQGNSDYLPSPYYQILLPGDADEQRAFWGMGQKSRNIGHRGSDPGIQTDLQFNADRQIGRVIFANVNAEDSEELWPQYEKIQDIIAEFEDRIAAEAGK